MPSARVEDLLAYARTNRAFFKFSVGSSGSLSYDARVPVLTFDDHDRVVPPADARLARLHAQKVKVLESIFLWEWYADDDGSGYDSLRTLGRLASSFGCDLIDMVGDVKQPLSEGHFWEDSDAWHDVFSNTGMETEAKKMLCEANVAGVVPADVAAFMAEHGWAHSKKRCEKRLLEDSDLCFCDKDISVNQVCRLVMLLRDWDLNTAVVA